MISPESIRLAVETLVREAHPERVILFGSYARGDAGPESDLDLLVVGRDVPRRQAEMARLRRVVSPLRIPVDIHLVELKQLSSTWADFPGSYLYYALREGQVLYAVDGASSPASS